jgi:hypothetical protein
MLAALPRSLEVEQVGGTFLEGLAGPILIALAAVFAAGIAAWIARKNHSQQLRHDREMRDLSHARASLSSAVETVVEAVDSVSELTTAVSEANECRKLSDEIGATNDEFLTTYQRDDDGDLIDTRTEEMKEAVGPPMRQAEEEAISAEAEAIEAETDAMNRTSKLRAVYAPLMTRMLADTLRLRIAIGNDSEVVKRHAFLVDAIADWAEHLSPDDDGRYRFDADPSEEVNLVGDRMEEFVETSQAWSADTAAA